MRVHTNARTYSKAKGRLIEDLNGDMSERDDDEDDEKESEVEFVDPAVRGSSFSSAHLSTKSF